MITQKLIEHINERVFRKILSVNGFGYANGGGFLRYLNPEQFDIISDVRRLKRDGRVFKRAIIKRNNKGKFHVNLIFIDILCSEND